MGETLGAKLYGERRQRRRKRYRIMADIFRLFLDGSVCECTRYMLCVLDVCGLPGFPRCGLFHQPKPVHNRLGGKFPCLKCIGSPSRTRTSSMAVSSGGRISRKEDDNVITVVYCVALFLSVIEKKTCGKTSPERCGLAKGNRVERNWANRQRSS